MTKKDKQELYETFAEAFHDVVLPLLENMATKEDLKREIGVVRNEMATKDVLKREIGFVRNDINDLRAEISTSPTRKEFEGLKRKVQHISA